LTHIQEIQGQILCTHEIGTAWEHIGEKITSDTQCTVNEQSIDFKFLDKGKLLVILYGLIKFLDKGKLLVILYGLIK
jgi:hypothetical protein